jgi:hypothetical protein
MREAITMDFHGCSVCQQHVNAHLFCRLGWVMWGLWFWV